MRADQMQDLAVLIYGAGGYGLIHGITRFGLSPGDFIVHHTTRYKDFQHSRARHLVDLMREQDFPLLLDFGRNHEAWNCAVDKTLARRPPCVDGVLRDDLRREDLKSEEMKIPEPEPEDFSNPGTMWSVEQEKKVREEFGEPVYSSDDKFW